MSDKLTWTELDTDTFPENIADLYDTYKDAQQVAKDERENFERALTKALKGQTPNGKVPVYGYRWGKVSVAFKSKAAERKASNVTKITL